MSCSPVSDNNKCNAYFDGLFKLAGYKGDKNCNEKIDRPFFDLSFLNSEGYRESDDIDRDGHIDIVETRYHLFTLGLISDHAADDLKLTDGRRSEFVDLLLSGVRAEDLASHIFFDKHRTGQSLQHQNQLLNYENEAIGLALEITEPKTRAETLATLAQALSEVGCVPGLRNHLLKQAVAAAQRITNKLEASLTLRQIGSTMAKMDAWGNDVGEVFRQALSLVGDNNDQKVQIAAEMAQAGLYQDAENLAYTFTALAYRASALGQVMQWEGRACAQDGVALEAPLFDDAFETIGRITDAESRLYHYLSLAFEAAVGNQNDEKITQALKAATKLMLAMPDGEERERFDELIRQEIHKIQDPQLGARPDYFPAILD